MKTVIITGANTGLGFETAKHIARKGGYNIILACRNMEKAEEAKEQIIKDTGNTSVCTMLLDTSSLQSVRGFVEEFKQMNVKLDCLICNAGISPAHSGTTADGFELVFATNHIGHFLLVNLLLSYMSENGRIINVTSDMHNPPGGLEWKDPDLLAYADGSDRKKYSYSKLANIYFTHELADRMKKANSEITVNAFNPGMMDTNFHGDINYVEREATVKQIMPHRVGDLAKSSAALAEVATSGEFDGVTGKFFDRSTKYVPSSELSYNEKNRIDLWNKSMKWVGLDKK